MPTFHIYSASPTYLSKLVETIKSYTVNLIVLDATGGLETELGFNFLTIYNLVSRDSHSLLSLLRNFCASSP
ncbi:MAG: hypothetical protein EWV76_15045 [Microcystis novacekii Mn_MB_F_20050700_S1]|uniref:Uncharacterized protein n=1 Tax=Microcystis novacekii Mn_MB_F_20050700_S1D TaxID=2486266 RepID=A0A552J026_9CHRO|nr:MAG: hypothetical protein EWV76_15045 [Microcystis novacekii Mn_MB_F_20050700_S1]TRU89032.1 MAG: hypothetical protein EWV54_09190 [Microcystis novacekii Mn_MB_F_20050700_S1D]